MSTLFCINKTKCNIIRHGVCLVYVYDLYYYWCGGSVDSNQRSIFIVYNSTCDNNYTLNVTITNDLCAC